MAEELKDTKIAILATRGFEEVELTGPRDALREAGAEVHVISPKDRQENGKIRAWKHTQWGDEVEVDRSVSEADPSEYDGLMLPGGVMNPDFLRLDRDAVAFVRSFFDQKKPIAAICHGPWMLVEADVVRGRRVTSWPSLQTDLRNAGAEWVDKEVVTDQGIVTSRKPDDLPAFNDRMIEEFREGVHRQRAA